MLLVYGPRSPTYDFGPSHPLTPRRFGPGIDLLRAVGAEPGLAPEPAPDHELEWCHSAKYLEIVRAFSADPFGLPAAGISEFGDVPPFSGMHDAGAMVAGGSLRAIEAILRGDVEHAFQPGGGLHHAMRDRASGFCIYNDPALAIARARRDGLRVLYVDLDVHHGDGVQALHWGDPGVLTISFHESGRYLFPGTGFSDELGEGVAAGTSVNVPLEPGCGEGPWLEAVRALVPALAASFGPDIVVSQHGADSHAWDPLAHLRVTTTAMGEAARLVDAVAHRWAGGRWLATGGGGYDAYRVVPRSWSLVWLTGAHRDVPSSTPDAWRERWGSEAARYGQAPLPTTFDDPPNAGVAVDTAQAAAEVRSRETWRSVRGVVVPALLREAIDRGWWDPLEAPGQGGAARNAVEASRAGGVAEDAVEAPRAGGVAGKAVEASRAGGVAGDPLEAPRAGGVAGEPSADGRPEATFFDAVDAEAWSRFALAARTVALADSAAGHELVLAALRDAAAGVVVSAAVVGDVAVGLCLSAERGAGEREVIALGVAPEWRRRGLGSELMRRHIAAAPAGRVRATITVAERDPVDPLPRDVRAAIARTVLERSGFTVRPATAGRIRADDPLALEAIIG